jgi:hypothetical protein
VYVWRKRKPEASLTHNSYSVALDTGCHVYVGALEIAVSRGDTRRGAEVGRTGPSMTVKVDAVLQRPTPNGFSARTHHLAGPGANASGIVKLQTALASQPVAIVSYQPRRVGLAFVAVESLTQSE